MSQDDPELVKLVIYYLQIYLFYIITTIVDNLIFSTDL